MLAARLRAQPLHPTRAKWKKGQREGAEPDTDAGCRAGSAPRAAPLPPAKLKPPSGKTLLGDGRSCRLFPRGAGQGTAGSGIRTQQIHQPQQQTALALVASV